MPISRHRNASVFSYLGLSSACLNRQGDGFVSQLIASGIPVFVFRICAHFGGVTRFGSASLGWVATGGGGRAGPYIQECHLVANVNLHIRSFLAVVGEVWCFWRCVESDAARRMMCSQSSRRPPCQSVVKHHSFRGSASTSTEFLI
jgi:hypothetical protein